MGLRQRQGRRTLQKGRREIILLSTIGKSRLDKGRSYEEFMNNIKSIRKHERDDIKVKKKKN